MKGGLRYKYDKSIILAQAGFTIENPAVLEQAIRDLMVQNEVVQERENRYGVFYRVSGEWWDRVAYYLL